MQLDVTLMVPLGLGKRESDARVKGGTCWYPARGLGRAH